MPEILMTSRGLDYHVWAMDRTMNAVRRLQEPPRDLLNILSHLAATDHLWLHRMGILDTRPEAVWPTWNFIETGRQWQTIRPVWIGLRKSLDTLDMDRRVTYTNTQGSTYTNTANEILHHVVNHGTHHRAQICRIIRETGKAPPVLDLIVFVREPDLM